MQEEILSNADDAIQLEQLYLRDKSGFRAAFDMVYPRLQHKPMAAFWQARLHPQEVKSVGANGISWGVVILLGLVAAFIGKIPAIFGLEQDTFYPRFLGFVVFPALTAYFIWRNSVSARKTLIAALVFAAGLLLMMLLPVDITSDTFILTCIHLPIVLWGATGFVFLGDDEKLNGRLDWLKFNGDLVVMTALIGLALGLMSGVTIGLFELIGIKIAEPYMEWVALSLAAAAPVVAAHLTQSNPTLVGKVSPVIAKIFSPIVLVMLVVYLITILMAGKSPFADRDFLIIFNALLLGVMALIFFAVSDKDRHQAPFEKWVLLLLTFVTIIINAIALSAVLFRMVQWGITPNRLAVLGANLLIFVNLLLVGYRWIRTARGQGPVSSVGLQIAVFLPVYVTWAAVVAFLFPLIFKSR